MHKLIKWMDGWMRCICCLLMLALALLALSLSLSLSLWIWIYLDLSGSIWLYPCSSDDGSLAPILIRLAWHSSGTYDASTKTGGSNNGGLGGATMRFGKEAADPENTGLDKARAFLDPLVHKYPGLTYSDLWILAAYVSPPPPPSLPSASPFLSLFLSMFLPLFSLTNTHTRTCISLLVSLSLCHYLSGCGCVCVWLCSWPCTGLGKMY